MKKLTLIFAFTAAVAFGQQPNCNLLNQTLSAAGAGTSYNNTTQQKCASWKFVYYAEGFATLSVQVESAPDNNGVPGAWSAVPAANVISGTNPVTTTTFNQIQINGYFPWIRVNLTAVTGTGFINYNLIGSSYVSPQTAVAAQTTPATASNQIVIGPDTPGAAPTQNPVQMGAFDGTNVERIRSTVAGALLVSPATNTTGADAVANTVIDSLGTGAALNPAATASWLFNGTTWDRQRTATAANNTAAVTVPGVGLAAPIGHWSMYNAPAVGVQASVVKAAVAGTVHVIDCISYSLVATAAPAATAIAFQVLDGATEVFRENIFISANTGNFVTPQHVCGLHLHNTAGNTMTVQFTALVANVFEQVFATGYSLQ